MRIISWTEKITVPEEGTTVAIVAREPSTIEEHMGWSRPADIRLYRPELPSEGVVAESYCSLRVAEKAMEHFLKAIEDEYLFYQFPDSEDMELDLEREKKNRGAE